MSDPWIRYFSDMTVRLEDSPERIGLVELTAQAASIAATAIPMPGLSAGLYRVAYYARITTAATNNSSLTVTFDWQDGGVTPTWSGAAITGNTTTTVQSGTLLLLCAASSPIRYSTTYASNGATAMVYKLYITCEGIAA